MGVWKGPDLAGRSVEIVAFPTFQPVFIPLVSRWTTVWGRLVPHLFISGVLPGASPRSIRARIAAVILFWSIATIAILNPLLCLAHCTLTRRHATLSAEQRLFLCDLGNVAEEHISGPFTAVWNGPRAVYEALPLTTLSVAIVIALVATLVTISLSLREHIPLLDRPPPRVLLHAHLRRAA